MSNTGNISSSENVTGAISGRRELNGRLSQGSSRVAGLVAAGSSGAGTSDYERLRNKPQIESVELIGNKSFEELGLEPITSDELIDILY